MRKPKKADKRNAELKDIAGERRRTVLIVEDDATHRRFMEEILGSAGLDVIPAENGLIALARLDAGQEIDLIIMDCQMPNMDGYEATQIARETDWGKSLTIVSLTANALQGDRGKCLAAGADDYLAKPVRIAEVVKVFEKYLKTCAAA